MRDTSSAKSETNMKPKNWKALVTAVVLVTLILVGSAAYYFVSATNERNEKYTPTISVNAVSKGNPQEIAENLVNQWLSHFKSRINIQDRLDNYEIHDIRLGEVQGDEFVVAVSFSVKPTINCSDWLIGILCSGWIAGNGTLQENGWIRHKLLFFKVIKESNWYNLQVMGTGP